MVQHKSYKPPCFQLLAVKFQISQEDAFEEIADLFNNDVFPLDRSVNIYEKLERNTEMKIEKKDGRLYFRRQQITAPSQPSVYSQSLDPVYDYGDSNVFDVHTDCSDGSDYVRLLLFYLGFYLGNLKFLKI